MTSSPGAAVHEPQGDSGVAPKLPFKHAPTRFATAGQSPASLEAVHSGKRARAGVIVGHARERTEAEFRRAARVIGIQRGAVPSTTGDYKMIEGIPD